MQNPSINYQSMNHQQFSTTEQQQEHLKCPRCESSNTKFCYYNNYNLSQPRHFCKNCRRYWTKGGALRNIPVGGSTRKMTRKTTKRSSSSSSSSSTATRILTPELGGVDQDHRMLDITGSFSSLLASNGQFGNLLNNGMNSSGGDGGGSSVGRVQFGDYIENLNSNSQASKGEDSFTGLQGDSSCWGGGAGSGNGNGWPDLSIYTPGSTFQ